MLSEHAPVRVAAKAGALVGFLPVQVVRGLFGRKNREQAADLPSALKTPSAALREPGANSGGAHNSPEFAPNMVVARRYGNE
jgi:hypothetical protein